MDVKRSEVLAWPWVSVGKLSENCAHLFRVELERYLTIAVRDRGDIDQESVQAHGHRVIIPLSQLRYHIIAQHL